MILTCPNCATKFKVKAGAIPPAGRKVKCKSCANVWHAMPEGEDAAPAPVAQPAPPPVDAAAPPPPPAPEPEHAAPPPPPPPQEDEGDGAMDGPPLATPPSMESPPIPTEAQITAAQRKPGGKKRSPLIAWIVLFVIIAGTSFGALMFSKDIVTAYPPANKIYSAIGLPVDLLGHGLTLHEPEWKRVPDSKALRIYGEIENTTDEKIELPMLRGVITNSDGLEIQTWTFEPPQPEILPGERVEFESIVEPKTGGSGLSITFASRDEAMMEGGDAMKNDETQ